MTWISSDCSQIDSFLNWARNFQASVTCNKLTHLKLSVSKIWFDGIFNFHTMRTYSNLSIKDWIDVVCVDIQNFFKRKKTHKFAMHSYFYTKEFIERRRFKESSKCKTSITIASPMRWRRVIIVVISMMMMIMMMTVATIRTLVRATVVIYFSFVRYLKSIFFKRKNNTKKSIAEYLTLWLWLVDCCSIFSTE